MKSNFVVFLSKILSKKLDSFVSDSFTPNEILLLFY